MHRAALLTLALLACDAKPAATDDAKAKSPLQPRGLDEMKRVRKDVEDANKAGLERTDNAIDGAMKTEAAGRGVPGR